MANEQGSAGDEVTQQKAFPSCLGNFPTCFQDMEVVGWDGGAEGQAGLGLSSWNNALCSRSLRNLTRSSRLGIAWK